MTPSHSLNKNRIKYYYYRCTSTQNAEKGRSRCRIKYVSLTKIESAFVALVASLSQEAQFMSIENQVLKHNQAIEVRIHHLNQQLAQLDVQLSALNQKKTTYFDSLISGSFSAKERQRINSRIDEMEAEEKQIKGAVFKQEFERNQTQQELINLSDLKWVLIQFKTEYESLGRTELRQRLTHIFSRIDYAPDCLVLHFKALPFPISFPVGL